MTHPNAQTLEKIYAHFTSGNIAGMLAACANNITFQVAGKSQLAGKYDGKSFISDFVPKLQKLSGGTLKMDIHDILASERHGLVLTTDSLIRDGKKIEYRSVHVWRFENGLPVAWYEYPRDLYQYDTIWS